MRTLIFALILSGCTGAPVEQEAPKCQNLTREFTAGVPFPWDVMDDEETTIMTNGCTLTTITHYVLEDSGSGIGGMGGSAPDPRHCDVDGCGGPLDRQAPYSDPVDVLTTNSLMPEAH